MINAECDVLVVGAGPAGLASASELLRLGAGRVVVLDKGMAIDSRMCHVLSNGICKNCSQCQILTGVGGASGILGGKLCFFPAGELLANHTKLSVDQANDVVLSFLETRGLSPLLGLKRDSIHRGTRYESSDVRIKDYYAIPLLRPVLQRLFYRLCSDIRCLGGIIKPSANVVDIHPGSCNARFQVVYTENDQTKNILVRKSIILASGRSGARWLSDIFRHIGVSTLPTDFDIGVRVQLPSTRTESMPLGLQDPKFKINEGASDEVRTLCWCRGGELSSVNVEGIHLVDGHFGDKWQPWTSVSVVSRLHVPVDYSPIEYASALFGGLRHLLPLRQNLSQFMGNHSKKLSSSTISFVEEPKFVSREADMRSLLAKPVRNGLTRMLEEIDNFLGGNLIDCDHAYVYGPVIDKFWMTPLLDSGLMTNIPGLYIAGDTTGLGRGIVQSLLGGIIVARSILKKDSRSVGLLQRAHVLSCGSI